MRESIAGIILGLMAATAFGAHEQARPTVVFVCEHGAASRPALVRAKELADARRAVALGCDLSRVASRGVRVDQWNEIPPMSAGYAPARAAIVERVKKLLEELESSAPR